MFQHMQLIHFEETSSAMKKKLPGSLGTICTPENVKIVHAAEMKSPHH